MKSPPSLNEIDRALLSLRQPAERRLIQIQDLRDRFLESHRHSTAVVDPVFVEQSNRLRRSVREHQRSLDRLPQSAFRTLVVCDRETERLSAIALVPEDAEIPEITIGDWQVGCVRCSFHLLRCQVGDVVPQGLVVSVNGSPLLAETQRRRKLDALRAPPVPPREQKLRERLVRGAKRNRFLAERLKREDVLQEMFFERRRATEEREKHLREKLRRSGRGPLTQDPEPVPDDSRPVPLVWDNPYSEAVEADRDSSEQPIPEQPEIAYVVSNELAGSMRSAEVSASTGNMVWVLVAFGAGCVAGLFVAPKWFSLVGALCAALASLALRVAWARRR